LENGRLAEKNADHRRHLRHRHRRAHCGALRHLRLLVEGGNPGRRLQRQQIPLRNPST
jgi:hypothetical protein